MVLLSPLDLLLRNLFPRSQTRLKVLDLIFRRVKIYAWTNPRGLRSHIRSLLSESLELVELYTLGPVTRFLQIALVLSRALVWRLLALEKIILLLRVLALLLGREI